MTTIDYWFELNVLKLGICCISQGSLCSLNSLKFLQFFRISLIPTRPWLVKMKQKILKCCKKHYLHFFVGNKVLFYFNGQESLGKKLLKYIEIFLAFSWKTPWMFFYEIGDTKYGNFIGLDLLMSLAAPGKDTKSIGRWSKYHFLITGCYSLILTRKQFIPYTSSNLVHCFNNI